MIAKPSPQNTDTPVRSTDVRFGSIFALDVSMLRYGWQWKDCGILVVLWGLMLWLCCPVFAVSPSEAEGDRWTRYERLCRDEVHVQCIRQGILWLQQDGVATSRKVQVYGYMAIAHLALDQKEQARTVLTQMITLAPCASQPPISLPTDVLTFFHNTRRDILHKDQAPPIITHIPLTHQQFRDTGTIEAKVTENLGLRQVTLYYRTEPQAAYQSQTLVESGREQFRTQLSPSVYKKTMFFQYYLEAEDCATRTARAQASNHEPFQVFLQAQGSSARTIGGGLLIALGSALVISSVFTFLSANSELERWKATDDLAKSEEIRNNILMFHGLGWGGLGLGLGSMATGIFLVLPRSPRPPSLVMNPRLQKPFISLSKEARHATKVRVSSLSSGYFHVRCE